MSPSTFLKIVLAGVILAAGVFLTQSFIFSNNKTSPPTTGKPFLQKHKTPQNNSSSLSNIPSSSTPDTVAKVHIRKKKEKPLIGGRFVLTDHKGIQRSNRDFRGRYMLVYFGYSFCPDICPTALYNITEALEALGNNAKKFQPIFITVDPKRDTVQELAKYVQHFHPSLIALTGSEEAITDAKKAYHVYAAKVDAKDESPDYLLDHSSIIYVMDHHGRYVTSFSHATPPETLLKGLLTLF